MNELQIFNYEQQEIRTIFQDDELWWVLKDVCDVLGLTESHRVAARLDEDDRTQMTVTDSLGRNQDTTVINESGLYNIILLSRKPEAKKFKRWVTHEVLPAIRKHGGYLTPLQKIFDANFGEVNLYHIDVFRAVYPGLNYGERSAC